MGPTSSRKWPILSASSAERIGLCAYPWLNGVIHSDPVFTNHYMRRGTLVGMAATRHVNGALTDHDADKTLDVDLAMSEGGVDRWLRLRAWLDETIPKYAAAVGEPAYSMDMDGLIQSEGVDINRRYPDENRFFGSLDLVLISLDKASRTVVDYKCGARVYPKYFMQVACQMAMCDAKHGMILQVFPDKPPKEHVVPYSSVAAARDLMVRALRARASGDVRPVVGKHCTDCVHRSLCDAKAAHEQLLQDRAEGQQA